MLIILIFISVVFAPFPPPTHNALPETFIQSIPKQKLSVNSQFKKTFSPLWTKLKAILNLRERKTNALPEPPKIKLSPEQLLQKLDVLSALPDDIQVKIILDTQNAQNAIQWLKMNKGSVDKLFKDPKFQPILPKMFKLSIMDKYYDADILKRILDYPNLVNWYINSVENNVQYVMGIYQFAKVIKDIDLSSAAGRQIQEFALLNIAKSINENPGKSFQLISGGSDIMAKIILSDVALTTKFTNDLSLANPEQVRELMGESAIYNSINTLELVLMNPIVMEKINLEYFYFALSVAVRSRYNDYFVNIIQNNHIASSVDADLIFRMAIMNRNLFAVESITKHQLFAKVSTSMIDYYFLYFSTINIRHDVIKTFIENSHLAEKISTDTFEKAMVGTVIHERDLSFSILLGARNIWKNMKFSLYLSNSLFWANARIKEMIYKNELFMKKLNEIKE